MCIYIYIHICIYIYTCQDSPQFQQSPVSPAKIFSTMAAGFREPSESHSFPRPRVCSIQTWMNQINIQHQNPSNLFHTNKTWQGLGSFCRFISRSLHRKPGRDPRQGSEVPFGFDFVGASRDDTYEIRSP